MSNSAIERVIHRVDVAGHVDLAAAAPPGSGQAADVVRAWTETNFQRLSEALQEARSDLAARAGSADATEADVTEAVDREPAWLVRPGGRARKVSVSMPEDLADAVRHRVGRGAFSQYVTAAVARQLEVDMLAELAEVLEAEHGPVPTNLLEEARREWPDHGRQ